ncbi:MAG TPA: Ig-like domain-containing protein, partial [Methanomassiliicoccales archaeon]
TFQVSTDNGVSWEMIGSPVILVDGKAYSETYTPAAPGHYEFQAVYGGDSIFEPSTSVFGTEQLDVVGSCDGCKCITLGQSVTDNATVNGKGAPFPMPTGTVTFEVRYGDGPWEQYGTVKTLNTEGKALSDWFLPLKTGHYNFRAIYSGDNNYYPSQSGETEEPLCVCPAESTTVTQLDSESISLGQSTFDTATVSGLGGEFPMPTGTVTFYVLVPGAENFVQYGGVKTLDCNGQATSDIYMPLKTGTFYFKAVYSGDINYKMSADGDKDEPLEVVQGPSSTTTELGAKCIILGQSVKDNATVSGLGGEFPIPTGSVTFWASADNGASWTQYGCAVELDCAGSAVSSTYYTPYATGIYLFKAVYSGDCNYLASESQKCDERLLVNPANSVTTTELGVKCIILGQSVKDNATVTGLGGIFPTPTGSVTFWASADNGVSWTQYGCAVKLCAGSATSSQFYTPLATGMYLFKAIYSGDRNYLPSESRMCDEKLVVNPAASATHTELGATEIVLGQSVSDNATVQGLGGMFPNPTGTVDFQVRYNGGNWYTYDPCVALVDGKATSKMYMPTMAGNYNFRAVYSGDVNYRCSSSAVCEEPLKVLKAATMTTTCLGTESIVLGQSVRDNATVYGAAGCAVPSGTVTFYVSADGGVSWTMVGNGPVALNADGKAQSEWYMPLAAGEYLFKAVYNGDCNYLPSESDLCSEPLSVDRAPSETTTDLGVGSRPVILA